MKSRNWFGFFMLLVFMMFPGPAVADFPPLDQVIQTPVGNVKADTYTQVPLITWGGDMATILANGNALSTTAGSIFDQQGLKLRLVRQDNFSEQVQAYLQGQTPYLRGTMGMLNMAAAVTARDPRTRPIIIYQHTWSNGGDVLVVRENIRTAADLKGKTIALQAYGPHVDYMAKILRDAGLSVGDVKLRWMKDLTGTEHSPAEALHDPGVDAAFVIIPDGLALTSGGTVGTGAEESVRGARMLLSTRTANRIIADVYAVRQDYLESHREDVERFVHGLLLGQQALRELFRQREQRPDDYRSMLTASALFLLDSDQATADAEALDGDCEYAGFRGNVRFFGDAQWPRNLENLTSEIQSALITLGLLDRQIAPIHAQWDYDRLRAGLSGTDDVPAPRFRTEEVARVVARRQALGTLDEGELFSFEINFQPNQNEFSTDLYAAEFRRVMDLAETYGGAIITVEGHTDPHRYLKLEREKADPVVLTRTQQAARNLSISRALAVRNSIVAFGHAHGVPLDESQFTVVGHGISQPRHPNPRTKEEWLANMRVVFRLIQIEAEQSVFEPLD